MNYISAKNFASDETFPEHVLNNYLNGNISDVKKMLWTARRNGEVQCLVDDLVEIHGVEYDVVVRLLKLEET